LLPRDAMHKRGICHDGIEVTITDDMEKASAFCEYFSSVFTKADVSREQQTNPTVDTILN